jgi:Sigma-70 region 2
MSRSVLCGPPDIASVTKTTPGPDRACLSYEPRVRTSSSHLIWHRCKTFRVVGRRYIVSRTGEGTPTRAGDRVERAYREHAPRVWRAVLAYSSDREIANDAVAEAFAQVLRRGDDVRDPLTWVWTAASGWMGAPPGIGWRLRPARWLDGQQSPCTLPRL